jgi:hypothetical protein
MQKNSWAQALFNFMREFVLAIGVAILIPMIAHYSTAVIRPAPEYVPEYTFDEAGNRQANPPEKVALYKSEQMAYQKVYFYIATLIGLLALVIGMFLPLVSLGVGFIIGGLSCLTVGYIQYWGQLHNILKLASLIAALLLILVISYRFIARATHNT